MNQPLVTIIVLHWRQRAQTQRCLEQLQQLAYDNYQVLVVDNGSHDGAITQLQRAFPQINTLVLDQNYGFAGGVNPGIRQALAQGSQYVLLLNNDALVTPQLLTELVTAHRQNPHLGVLSPKIVRDQQPDQLAGLGCRIKRFGIELIGWNEQDRGPRNAQPVLLDAVFGCAMLMPRAVLEKVGLFDERFFFYYEDIDYCQRVNTAGYAVAYLPHVIVRHAVGASTRHIRGLRDFYLARSRELFFRKHCYGMQRLVFTLVEIGQVLRVMRGKLKQREGADALGYMAGALVGLIMPTPDTAMNEG